MITSAFNSSDYHYFNRRGKAVCFHFKFNKRCKTKLIDFLKNNHEEAKILKYCEDVYVFPYRVTLELIQYLDYLTIEEIAMFVFFIRDSSEIAMKVKEIKNFRNLSRVESEDLVNTFKDTKIGNKTLKQAPSAGYFMQFCTGSGILEKRKIKMKDTSKKVSALFIKEEKIEWVKETLYQYKNIVPYTTITTITVLINSSIKYLLFDSDF